MKVAIYARHSTDKQEHSTRDQLARCHAHCQRFGYKVTATFCDEGISGAAMQNRPGIRGLIEAALDGVFTRIITEDLSRLSRDQGDIAHFYKKLLFLGIGLETIAEGQVTELHIGLKGTMNALFLKDLADKTKRGMIAAVLNGAIPGGRTFGYDIVRKMNERGEPIPGLRKINRKEAEIVRQVFSRYQAGDSLRRISAWLNSLDIPSPRGSSWQPSAFIGTVSRQTGILRNTLYKGLVTFDRMAYRKHPETGKRLSVMRPESEWIKVPAPELAIIDPAEFDAIQLLIEERSNRFRQQRLIVQVMTQPEKAERRNEYQRSWRARQIKSPRKTREQPLYLTSGKLWCARHDTAFVYRRSRLHGCAEPGCANQNLPHEYLMPLILAELQQFDLQHIEQYFVSQDLNRRDLLLALKRLEHQRRTVQQEIRSLLTTITRSQRGPETLAHIQDRELEIGRMKLDIDRIKSDLGPVTRVSDETAFGVVRNFRAAVSRHAADQAATKLLHGCIDRIYVLPDWNEAEQTMQHRIRVVFNIPETIKSLRNAAIASAA